MNRDERISKLNEILIGGVEKREVRLVGYDPHWPEMFELHAAKIRRALGEVALRIEHIGSTSVPGLAAKPIVDMLLFVADSRDEGAYLAKLEAVGYVLRVREPDWFEHRMFRTPDRDVHVHVFSLGCSEIERHLIFRDRLRTNAEDRQRYEDTKRRLAAQDWPDVNFYADAKSEVVEAIIAAARKENDDARSD
jgi:GrpB-like predicted nucleotidyltransferase (UPF0157 family)